jgi:hypothetical protein
MTPQTAFRIGAGFGEKQNALVEKLLEKEAKSRLREAPIASAPIPGERSRDLERLAEIRRRQKQQKTKKR